MIEPTSDRQLVSHIAEARTASAFGAMVAGFGDVTRHIVKHRAMMARINEDADLKAENAKKSIEALNEDIDTATVAKLVKRLVEFDAVISPLGEKRWLSDAHRGAEALYYDAAKAHAKGKASLSQVQAARILLSATRRALQALGRTLEQPEKKQRTRTASKMFTEADYPDPQVRRAIVLWVLNNNPESVHELESHLYDLLADRAGCISSLLDACGSGDSAMNEQALRIATEILVKDANNYHVEALDIPPHSRSAAVTANTIGQLARAKARGFR